MVPEKDDDPPSQAPQGQRQDQEEARGEGEKVAELLPEKDESAPSDAPKGQNQEKVRRSLRLSMRQGQPVRLGHDKEPSKKREYRGIWPKNGKWATEIRDGNGERHWLGTHATREEAAHAYDGGAKKYGRFDVKLNFPDPSEGELHPSLQPMSQGNSVNRPPAVMHQPFIREHTNDVNMRDRPTTSAGVVANIETARSHQNATNGGKEDSADQVKESAEVGHCGMRVASFRPELVALPEEQHDYDIDAIEALLSLSTSQEGKNKSESEE